MTLLIAVTLKDGRPVKCQLGTDPAALERAAKAYVRRGEADSYAMGAIYKEAKGNG